MENRINLSDLYFSENIFPELTEKKSDKIKKIKLMCSVSNNEHYLHIICTCLGEADYFATNFNLSNIDFQKINNEIILLPYSILTSSGTEFDEKNKEVMIRLKSKKKADLFLEIIDGSIDGIVQKNNYICFLEPVEEKKVLVTSILLNAENGLQTNECDISDTYGTTKYYNKTLPIINTIPDLKINPQNTKKAPIPIILDSYSTEVAIKLNQFTQDKRLITIFANGHISGGDSEEKGGQEEKVLGCSNATFAMPKKYKNGLVQGYGGIYKIANVELKNNDQQVMVDLAFVAMPNMGYANGLLGVPSEKNYFTRKTYLKHVILLVMLQFYLARFSNHSLITGRHGCGSYHNDDRDIAAILKAVNEMPEFRNIQLFLALGINEQVIIDNKTDTIIKMNELTKNKGKKTTIHDIYNNHEFSRSLEVQQCIEELRLEIKNFTPNSISQYLVNNYKTGLTIGKKIDKIFDCFYEIYHEQSHSISKDFKSTKSKKQLKFFNKGPIVDTLLSKEIIEELMPSVRNGLHAGKSMDVIMAGWKNVSEDFKIKLRERISADNSLQSCMKRRTTRG